jgi:hypothetical protein
MAMMAVFIFHCTRFFDTEGWHVKNPEQSEPLFVLVRGFFWPWMMELFFLLSGVGTWYALKSRGAGAYLWERVKRLGVPLYTVGVFVLLPPQFYFELVTNEGFGGTFREMISRYFAGFYPPHLSASPDTLLPIPFAGHLWFLRTLFLISVIALPMLLYLRSAPGQRWIKRLAGWCDRRGGVFLFVIPLAVAMIGLRRLREGQGVWDDFLWYAIYFVIGFVISVDERFTDSVKRHGRVCLALWLGGFFGGMSLLVLVFDYDPSAGHESSLLIYVLAQTVWSICSWSAVVFVLSLGARYLNFNHKMLAHGNEAVLPFYLFHQTIILIVGFFVIRLNAGIAAKFLIVFVISLPLILVLYGLMVRPFKIMRFFFGMRPRKVRGRTA